MTCAAQAVPSGPVVASRWPAALCKRRCSSRCTRVVRTCGRPLDQGEQGLRTTPRPRGCVSWSCLQVLSEETVRTRAVICFDDASGWGRQGSSPVSRAPLLCPRQPQSLMLQAVGLDSHGAGDPHTLSHVIGGCLGGSSGGPCPRDPASSFLSFIPISSVLIRLCF